MKTTVAHVVNALCAATIFGATALAAAGCSEPSPETEPQAQLEGLSPDASGGDLEVDPTSAAGRQDALLCSPSCVPSCPPNAQCGQSDGCGATCRGGCPGDPGGGNCWWDSDAYCDDIYVGSNYFCR
jgi:hypothetical protein